MEMISSNVSTAHETLNSESIVVNDHEGEVFHVRDGRVTVKIIISRQQGSRSISFLSSSLPPGDGILVHKHLNEDEILIVDKGSGLFTLGEKQYSVQDGSVMIIPKGVWHGLQNNSNENIELRFGFTPSGSEEFFREVGTPIGQTFVQKTLDERKSIAKKWGILFKD